MDNYKGQVHTRSRSRSHKTRSSSPKYRKNIESAVLLHVSRHPCEYLSRNVTKVKVKVIWLLKIETVLFE